MFIIAYLALLLAQANRVVVPHTVWLVVGTLAILEGLFYLAVILLQAFIFKESLGFRRRRSKR